MNKFPNCLLNATPEQRNNYELSGGSTGIHWEEIDEDISVSGLLLGNKDLAYYKKRYNKLLSYLWKNN